MVSITLAALHLLGAIGLLSLPETAGVRRSWVWLLAGFMICTSLSYGLDVWNAWRGEVLPETALHIATVAFGVGSALAWTLLQFSPRFVSVAQEGLAAVGAPGATAPGRSGAGLVAAALTEDRLSADLLGSIIEALPIAVFVKDAVSLSYIYCNRAGQQFLGLTAQDVIGRTEAQILPFDQGRIFEDLDRRVLATGLAQEVDEQTISTQLHGVRSVRVTKIPLFGAVDAVERIVELIEDITAPTKAAAELRQAKVFLESIVDNIPSTVIVKDAKTLSYILINKAGLELLDHRADQVLGKFDYQLFPPSQAADRMTEDRRILNNRVAVDSPEDQILSRTTGMHYMHSKKIPLYGVNGEPSYLLSIAEDITTRKKAESDLRQAKAFLESIVENIPHMIFVKRAADSRYVSLNRAGETLIGHKRADLVGKSDFDIFPAESAQQYVEADREVIRSGTVMDIPEEPIDSLALGRRYLHTKKIALLDDAGVPVYLLGISEDITERKHYEEMNRRREAELAHAQRLISVGEIGATLAHEFNQPVAAIANYAEGALMRFRTAPNTPPEIIEVFERISQLAVHAGSVVRGMRNLARKQVSDPEWVDFNELVRETMRLLDAKAERAHVKIHLQLAADVRVVRACRLQLQQLLVNLVMNAVEALTAVAPGERWVEIVTERTVNNALLLRVEDSGLGLPEEVAERLFEPFITTKPNGVGLGLSICHSIVEAHRGSIRVDSGRIAGLALEIILPTGGEGHRA